MSTVLRRAGLACVLLPAALAAQGEPLPLKLAPRPTQGPIAVPDLMTRLYRIADDSLGGRPTGSEGHRKATQYIADELQRLGLRPAGDSGSYFQDIGLVRRGFAPASAVTLGGRRFAMGPDFVPMVARGARPRAVRGTFEIIVGGLHADSTNWISADEARGKLVVLMPNPARLRLDQRFTAVYPNSRFAGAAALVVPAYEQMPEAIRRQAAEPQLAMGGTSSRGPEMPPALVATTEMAEALMAAAGQTAQLAVEYQVEPMPGRNVVAVLPGSDPALAGQFVAIGAHSDHDPEASVGVDHDSLRASAFARERAARRAAANKRNGAGPMSVPAVNLDSLRALRPPRRDSIYNGADDDGSGTVVLLELAEAFATTPERPKRSLLFVFHAGEELGLLGSEYFTDHPAVPMDSVVAQLNMDMVGRGGAADIVGGGPTYLQLVGSRRLSRELGDLIERVNGRQAQPFRFDYSFDADGHPERIYCRSDHAMYARFGVPVTFFHTGLHPDYHEVTDEPQYIDYAKMARVATLVHDVAQELANRADRPRLDAPKPDPRAVCRQ